MVKWNTVLASFFLAIVSADAADVSAPVTPVFHDGANCLFIGHSFFIPVAKSFDAMAKKTGFPSHQSRFVFAGGKRGAPGELWNNPNLKNQIEEVLASGKVELFGMTAFGELSSSLDDYKRWIDLALKHNPGTRFFIGVSWVPGGTRLETDPYNKVIEAVGESLFKTVAELRKAYPKNQIYFINYGKVASELKSRHDVGQLPDVTMLFGKGDMVLFADNKLGHGGPMILDLSALVWLKTLYGADLNEIKYPVYKTDVNKIVEDVIKYNRKYR